MGGLGVQAGFGLAQPCQPPAPGGQLGRERRSTGGRVLLVFLVFTLIGLGGLGQHVLDLGLDPSLELLVGAVALGGGVGGQLGAVQGHGAQPEQPGRGTQPQRLDQQPGQGLLMAGPEAGDGDVIRVVLAARTRKAMSSWQRRSIWREERMPVQ